MRVLRSVLAASLFCWVTGTAFGQPVNDDCTGAIQVFCNDVVFGDTADPLATVDTPATCVTTSGTGAGVWYHFAGNGDQVTMTTCGAGTNFDTKIRVYSGDCAGLVCVTGNDDMVPACPLAAFRSRVVFLTTVGVDYYVLVHGFSAAEGLFELSVTCLTPGVEICDDGLDNDLDGLVDCADMADCPTGIAPCIEICDDGIDNDGDGLVDCADMTDCPTGIAPCIEICDDGIDNDGDGLADCADSDCSAELICQPPANDLCDFALPIVCNDVIVGSTTVATVDTPATCGTTSGTAGGVWYAFTGNGDQVIITTCNPATSFDTKLRVYSGTCAGLVCVTGNDDMGIAACPLSGLRSRVVFLTTPGETYYVLVHGFGAAAGTYELSVTCVTPGPEICDDGLDNDLDGLIDCADTVDCPPGTGTCVEICGDGIDNDADGLVDCNDGDCAADATCLAGGNDFCGGALPLMCGDVVTGNTTTATADPWPTCVTSAGTGGGVWYSFLGNGDQVTITTCNPGTTFDTKLRVWSGSCAAPVCVTGNDDMGTAACPASGLRSRVAFLTIPGETYYVLVHGFSTAQGPFELSVTCLTPGVEICDDGLDNDLDGLIDCADMVDCPTGIAPCIEDCTDGIDNDGDGLIDCADVADCGALSFCQPPANDDCINATVVGLGAPTSTGTLLVATNDGTATCGASTTSRDVWYSFQAPTDGTYVFSTCGTHDDPAVDAGMDTVLALFDMCGGTQLACNDDNGAPGCQGADTSILRDSVITRPMLSGEIVLIRVAHFGTVVANGEYVLNITQDCGGVAPVTCSYDCTTNVLSVTWTDNLQATAGYEILENGMQVGTAPAGSSMFSLIGPVAGANTYTVTWTCGFGGPGTSGSCAIAVQPPITIPGTVTDVILHLEGLDDGGNLGQIDSGLALENALVANGRSVARIAPPDFDLLIASNCLDLSAAETIWVLTGTWPIDYRLSVGEGNALAALAAAGKGIYLEAGDHWGFLHVVSNLDARDGVDATGNTDGDDSFTSMNGANAVVAMLDLSAYVGVTYNHDSAGNDYTDRLAVTGGDLDVTSAEVTWTQAGLSYNVGVVAIHMDGGVMLSQSWEFGGFGGDQNALALDYLGALGRTGAPAETFVRGRCNGDGAVNIADAVYLLGFLFPGANPPNVLNCRDACDANDDGALNIADVIRLLGSLFGAVTVPLPLPNAVSGCGVDPTDGDALECVTPAGCP